MIPASSSLMTSRHAALGSCFSRALTSQVPQFGITRDLCMRRRRSFIGKWPRAQWCPLRRWARAKVLGGASSTAHMVAEVGTQEADTAAAAAPPAGIREEVAAAAQALRKAICRLPGMQQAA